MEYKEKKATFFVFKNKSRRRFKRQKFKICIRDESKILFSDSFNDAEDTYYKNKFKLTDCGEDLKREIPETRVILHADVDSYEFQLWARKKRPDLIQKNSPVVIVNHDKMYINFLYE